MRDRLDEFGDTCVAVVSFAPAEDLAAYRDHLALPFPVLSDPDRALYRRLGLRRARLRDVFNAGTRSMYKDLMAKGRQVRRPVHDIRQLGGDFVFDADGRLVAEFRPPSPDARPTVDDLLAAVTSARTR